MRVISGKYRGKKLNPPKNNSVRPTTDKVKEMIFDVIQFGLQGSYFIDLFAGSGSMGIEAISRGADDVLFVDLSRDSIKLINENLSSIHGKYKVLNRDYVDALSTYNYRADFIFVDAPYKLDVISNIVDIVEKKDILNTDGTIIYEHSSEFNDYKLPLNYYIKKRKISGQIIVDFIKKTNHIAAITGTFDPMTLGHLYIIDEAFKNEDKLVLLVSHNENKQEVFSFDERVSIAKETLKDYLNIEIHSFSSYVYEYLNKLNVNKIYRSYRNEDDYKYELEIADFNKSKGNIETVLIEGNEKIKSISSTKVRDALKNNETISYFVPKSMVKYIERLYKDKR